MRIVAVGVDLVEVDRIRRGMRSVSFLERFTTETERSEHRGRVDQAEGYAGILAMKEAAVKTLTPERSDGLLFRQIEISGPPPSILLRGRALDLAKARGIDGILVSVSHEAGFAVGMAVATGV
jgi:phosphopantetheine--protein transferase-like protein